MKFTLSWLTDHLETEAELAAIAEKLTMIGLEAEEVVEGAKVFAGFVVGHVLEARPHPNADRLRLCVVDTGSGTFEVVCGAPNARTGMKGVYAPVGGTIPGLGTELKKAKIRGVESHGMLLSERELGLGEDHDGIIELDPDAPIGAPFAQAVGLDDPVIDVAVTPNRADCLGVRGIARDLAAAGMGRFKPETVEPVPGRFESPVRWRLDFAEEAGNACPFIVGRTIRGVSNGASPKWLQNRLEAIGLRPISALVDVTNFFAYDQARPLHVYDVDKVKGSELVVRMGRPGERFAALNDRAYGVDESMIVIADENGPQGLGGVVGGQHTGCTQATTTVFLEAALFDPLRIAATGRILAIESDARYRFERGVDPTSALRAAETATAMIIEFCGGEASEVVTAGGEPDWRRTLELRPERVRTLGGVEAGVDEASRILCDLGFEVTDGEGQSVSIPPWRGDVEGEADLVEEVLRIHGYDNIPVVPVERATSLPRPALDTAQRRAGHVRRALAGRGLVEAVTFSFVSTELASFFVDVPDTLRLANPISSDLNVMRPSVLPHLVAAVGRNADRGLVDVGLFEVGPEFAADTPEGQARVAAGVRAGRTHERHWADAERSVDALDAKADALAALDATGAAPDSVRIETPGPGWYHPGRSGVLKLGPKAVLAAFGEIHPRILRTLDVRGQVAGFEVFLDAIPLPKAGRRSKSAYRPSPYQAVERDFAFVLDEGVPAEAVLSAAKAADNEMIAGVGVFDVYTGEGVPEGKKSLAISVRLQPTDRTLTDDEIESVAKNIVDGVGKATGGVLRG